MILNGISVPYAGKHAQHPAREPIRFTGRFDPRLFSTFNVMSSPATVPQTCKAARIFHMVRRVLRWMLAGNRQCSGTSFLALDPSTLRLETRKRREDE
ncbi:MAG TPA: hypothetical protein VFA41_09075 [Ktedonobacteraceae bacterium]|jgi:hypothetical protein|nr:hypothetical protein [Ktedonobacteraceae bacterium]